MSWHDKTILSDTDISEMMSNASNYTASFVAGRRVRDHYKRLITEGKLRVVEEVENDSSYPLDFRCSGCSKWAKVVDIAYCPGCGNKIKRQ